MENLIKTGILVQKRQKVRDLFKDELADENIANDLEAACFLYANTDKKYTSKARFILGNLRNQNNRKFAFDITNKKVDVIDVPFLSSHEIYPELRKPILELLEKRFVRSILFDNTADNSGIFTCAKCKSKNTTYYSLQTRSADEPMTHFVTCLNCNIVWKE